MNKETCLYYSACGSLWWILSGYDYLVEDISSTELDQRCRTSYTQFEDLAKWLLDELFSAGDCEGIDEKEAKALRSEIETLEPLVLEWAERVRAAAHDASEDARTFDEETRLYYFACGWSLRILYEFDRLLKDINSTKLHQRYREAYVKFESLSKWLQGELSSAGNREGVSEGAAKTLRARIEGLAEQLATEWREKVHEMSRDVNNKL